MICSKNNTKAEESLIYKELLGFLTQEDCYVL
jgi:hypothetical protein